MNVWIAAGPLIILLAYLGMSALFMVRGSSRRTDLHTEEVYHGNWWSTWHRPRDIWVQTAAGGIAMAATVGATVLVLLGTRKGQ